jgi:hypothetical protein
MPTNYFPNPIDEWKRGRLAHQGTVILFHGPQAVAHDLSRKGFPCGALDNDGYPIGISRALKSQTRPWKLINWYRTVQATMTPGDYYPMAFHPSLDIDLLRTTEIQRVIEIKADTEAEAMQQLRAVG